MDSIGELNYRKNRVLKSVFHLYFCVIMNDYERIEKAIGFLQEHFKEQPDLDEVARAGTFKSIPFSKNVYAMGGGKPQKIFAIHQCGICKRIIEKRCVACNSKF